MCEIFRGCEGNDETLRLFGETPLITNAKNIFDAAKSISSAYVLRLAQKRTAIEVAIVCERLEAMAGFWRWVSSAQQQLADGLNKPSARDALHQLKYDPAYTAAKKVTKVDTKRERPRERESLRESERERLQSMRRQQGRCSAVKHS